MAIYRYLAAFLFVVGGSAFGQTSFWNSTTTPGTPQVTSDTSSVTLGLKFYSDVAGSVTGLRFYKGPNNTGTHVGTLWSSTGAKLAQVTFSGETTSGWQQANFAAPITLSPNTTYVISYLAPKGSYANDQWYPWPNLSATPLHPSGSAPGVFAYGSSVTFPTKTWNASNYWVDVVFVPQTNTVPGVDGNSFWSNSMTPGTAQVTNDASSVTLGLKFYSDVPGSVSGVRFYKGTSNTGTHVGTLWSNTGTKLAEVTFAAETASGWQQANFAKPVAISANTTYVISYLAPKGYYANDQFFSWSRLSAAPLRVAGSSPGVFAYGSTTKFPTGTWNSSNYWVDLVFTPSTTPPSGNYSISGRVSGSAATLTLSGAASATTKTDSSGNYAFANLANGAYTVAPSQSGFTFSPSSTAVSINGANVTNVNFSASSSTPVAHSVSLSWVMSTSPNVRGYNVYRAGTSGGPYTQITSSLVPGTSYVDGNVAAGQTYYYVATTVDTNNNESTYSNQSTAVVPSP